MMNWENVKRILREGTTESAENNEALLNEIAQKKAELAETEQVMITLQDCMIETERRIREYKKEIELLETEYYKKRSISDTIGKIFKAEKVVDTSVESNDTEQLSQKMSSALTKLRYDFKKGAISEEEFKQGIQELKDSIDELDM